MKFRNTGQAINNIDLTSVEIIDSMIYLEVETKHYGGEDSVSVFFSKAI